MDPLGSVDGDPQQVWAVALMREKRSEVKVSRSPSGRKEPSS
jgi:hypothetical protein